MIPVQLYAQFKDQNVLKVAQTARRLDEVSLRSDSLSISLLRAVSYIFPAPLLRSTDLFTAVKHFDM